MQLECVAMVARITHHSIINIRIYLSLNKVNVNMTFCQLCKQYDFF